MPQTLSVTEAVRHFSDVMNRVYYQRHSYLLTRGGIVVAQLISVGKALTGAELARRWAEAPTLDPEDVTRWEEELTQLKAHVPPLEVNVWDS